MTKPTDRRRTIYIHVLSAIASDLPCSRFGSDARSTEQWLIPTQNRRLCPLVSIPTKPTWTISAVTLQRKAAVKWRQVVLRVERLNGRARQSDPSAGSSTLKPEKADKSVLATCQFGCRGGKRDVYYRWTATRRIWDPR